MLAKCLGGLIVLGVVACGGRPGPGGELADGGLVPAVSDAGAPCQLDGQLPYCWQVTDEYLHPGADFAATITPQERACSVATDCALLLPDGVENDSPEAVRAEYCGLLRTRATAFVEEVERRYCCHMMARPPVGLVVRYLTCEHGRCAVTQCLNGCRCDGGCGESPSWCPR